jgi:methylated-DNA-[protein]-cysteine S-methyltransferase
MMSAGFELFDTSIGRCGIAWTTEGIVGLVLPEHTDRVLRARMQQRHPDAKEGTGPPEVQRVVADVQRLLAGETRDLSAAVLDMTNVSEFDRRVYIETRLVPPGRTVTYGDIANRLGDAGLARAVGQALGRNPIPLIVPCHRVLAALGRLGGFSAPGGVATKQRLLEIEGARALQPPLPWSADR